MAVLGCGLEYDLCVEDWSLEVAQVDGKEGGSAAVIV